MCGITGIYNFDKEKPVNRETIKLMTSLLEHRGPDGEGFFIKGNVALGHRRLSIIDLCTGDQPMSSEDGSIVIIFNGEIYNYLELKGELKKLGHAFKTDSDTEVIIKAYQQWGIDCQNKFNGMWAFAIWDDNREQMFLSRDRLGEKPLHYSIYGKTLIFGSEIKAILGYGLPAKINSKFLEIYLTFGYVPGPDSLYKNIYKLKPGHFLIVKNGEIKERKYWDLPEIDEENMLSDRNKVYEEFEYLLTDAVQLRMRSDVPYGAFLSGGLDSSSIVSIMSQISDFPVQTFTIGYEEKAFDERSLAKEVANKFGTDHHEKIITADSFEATLDGVVDHFDEPFGDSSAIPTSHVSKYARENVKMVLTGDGGDEALSGYTTYQGEVFASKYHRVPKLIRNSLPTMLQIAAKPLKGSARYKLNRAINVFNSSDLDFNNRLIEKIAWTDKEVFKSILDKKEEMISIEDYISDFMKDCPFKDNFYKLMYYNLKLSLPEDMLVKVDRMSMAFSLETRTPFLDHRLIELMAKVHKNIKMEGYERKAVLRNTIGKRLPDSLLRAPKKGFNVPVREWFKEKSFQNYLSKLTKKDILGLKTNVINGLINDNASGRKDYGNFIWMLVVLSKWSDKVIKVQPKTYEAND